jgi:hypothetical protein
MSYQLNEGHCCKLAVVSFHRLKWEETRKELGFQLYTFLKLKIHSAAPNEFLAH